MGKINKKKKRRRKERKKKGKKRQVLISLVLLVCCTALCSPTPPAELFQKQRSAEIFVRCKHVLQGRAASVSALPPALCFPSSCHYLHCLLLVLGGHCWVWRRRRKMKGRKMRRTAPCLPLDFHAAQVVGSHLSPS